MKAFFVRQKLPYSFGSEDVATDTDSSSDYSRRGWPQNGSRSPLRFGDLETSRRFAWQFQLAADSAFWSLRRVDLLQSNLQHHWYVPLDQGSDRRA